MNFENLMKLVEAGFTKDEILKLGATDEEVKAEVKEEVKAEVKEEVKEEPKKDDFTILLDEFKELKEDLKKRAIMSDALEPKVNTSEDILASIINPYSKEKI